MVDLSIDPVNIGNGEDEELLNNVFHVLISIFGQLEHRRLLRGGLPALAMGMTSKLSFALGSQTLLFEQKDQRMDINEAAINDAADHLRRSPRLLDHVDMELPEPPGVYA